MADEINSCLELLKRHIPYYESDHVLNLAYNILSGGHCLQDIELLRKDEGWLDALDAEIIPAPTTAGDFLRRFNKGDIIELMEAKNTIRKKIWQEQPKNFHQQAVINVDGTISPIDGRCKRCMDLSIEIVSGHNRLHMEKRQSAYTAWGHKRPVIFLESAWRHSTAVPGCGVASFQYNCRQ